MLPTATRDNGTGTHSHGVCQLTFTSRTSKGAIHDCSLTCMMRPIIFSSRLVRGAVELIPTPPVFFRLHSNACTQPMHLALLCLCTSQQRGCIPMTTASTDRIMMPAVPHQNKNRNVRLLGIHDHLLHTNPSRHAIGDWPATHLKKMLGGSLLSRMPTDSSSRVRISLCPVGFDASSTISSRSADLHTAMTCRPRPVRSGQPSLQAGDMGYPSLRRIKTE